MWHVLKRSPEKRSRLGGRRVVPEGDDEDEVQDVRVGRGHAHIYKSYICINILNKVH